MGRQPCCEKIGLKRGPWTSEEDQKLTNFILTNGIQCWRLVPKLAGLMRCGKSCRLRWINYLRPDLKRGAFTEQEEDMIVELHSRLGNRWSTHFPGRTDNEIKNHWNTRIKKKIILLGLDPSTHKPIEHAPNSERKKIDHKLEDQEAVSSSKDHQISHETDQDDNESVFIKNLEIGSSESMGNYLTELSQDWIDCPFLWDSIKDSIKDSID